MMRSLRLRTEPTVRQANAIVDRLAAELETRGVKVTRPSVGSLRFSMPHPWNARSLGLLAAITSGTTVVSAGSGGPRRVRYALRFTGLRALTALASVVLVVAGWSWPRTELILALLALWAVMYGLLSVAAMSRFQRILGEAARDVIERRATSRTPSVEHSALPPDGAGKG